MCLREAWRCAERACAGAHSFDSFPAWLIYFYDYDYFHNNNEDQHCSRLRNNNNNNNNNNTKTRFRAREGTLACSRLAEPAALLLRACCSRRRCCLFRRRRRHLRLLFLVANEALHRQVLPSAQRADGVHNGVCKIKERAATISAAAATTAISGVNRGGRFGGDDARVAAAADATARLPACLQARTRARNSAHAIRAQLRTHARMHGRTGVQGVERRLDVGHDPLLLVDDAVLELGDDDNLERAPAAGVGVRRQPRQVRVGTA
jgi:hypothetical protein